MIKIIINRLLCIVCEFAITWNTKPNIGFCDSVELKSDENIEVIKCIQQSGTFHLKISNNSQNHKNNSNVEGIFFSFGKRLFEMTWVFLLVICTLFWFFFLRNWFEQQHTVYVWCIYPDIYKLGILLFSFQSW